MPFRSSASMIGGNLDSALQSEVYKVLCVIDKKVQDLALERGLYPAQVRLLQPLHFCVIVNDDTVFVVVSNRDVGGMPTHQFIDWSSKEMDLNSALFLVARDLAFQDPFGFQFPKAILGLEESEKDPVMAEIGERLIQEETDRLEKLKRLVRINPIFQGRDFQLDESLVFVLTPLSDPFNTIFNEHLKPTVESIGALRCIKADNIYNNRPIIEDIWRQINEAGIVVSELTGRNANVFYETGISHTVGKEVILITQSIDDVPFDLRHLRCIVYEYTPPGVRVLETNLKNTILAILNRQN